MRGTVRCGGCAAGCAELHSATGRSRRGTARCLGAGAGGAGAGVNQCRGERMGRGIDRTLALCTHHQSVVDKGEEITLTTIQ